MKKTLSVFSLLAILTLCFISCDINSSRPLTANVTVKVTNVPKEVGAIALFCNLNEWKASEVMEHNDVFIADVGAIESKTAIFVLKDYTLATTFKFQFTPMENRNVELGDDWWSYALSGSASYSNYENNLVVNFAQAGKVSNVTLVVSKDSFSSTGGTWEPFPIYGKRSCRRWNEGYNKCFVLDPDTEED